MFQLESCIAEWRNQMLAAGIKFPTPLDELELHLREEIEHLSQSGLTPEQAFANAAREMGTPAALRKEYQKLGQPPSQKLAVFRPYALGISFVLGVFFTTPEIINQILAFAMFVAAYEMEIRILRWLEHRDEPPTRQIGIALTFGSGMLMLILHASKIPLVAHLSRTTHQDGHVIVDNWSQPEWYTLGSAGLFLVGIGLAAWPRQPVRFNGSQNK